MELTVVEPGYIAEIVTYLDMRERPKPQPHTPSPLRLKQWQPVNLVKYRTLFDRVGRHWLWYSRLEMDDAALDAVVNDDAVAVYAVEDRGGIELGMVELDWRVAGDCEIQFFGLVPELAGKGHGRWLMGETLRRAWRKDVTRVHLHTCTIDHPGALAFYRKIGFVPRGRAVEINRDPRVAGIFPRGCAPHVPIIE